MYIFTIKIMTNRNQKFCKNQKNFGWFVPYKLRDKKMK